MQSQACDLMLSLLDLLFSSDNGASIATIYSLKRIYCFVGLAQIMPP